MIFIINFGALKFRISNINIGLPSNLIAKTASPGPVVSVLTQGPCPSRRHDFVKQQPEATGWVVFKQFPGIRGERQGGVLEGFDLFFEELSDNFPDEVSIEIPRKILYIHVKSL